jgi:DNA-binding transcriptional ArsR family regulator
MSDSNDQNMARMFRALAAEKRLEIIQLLSRRTLCAGALSRMLGISPGAVSQHLRILKDAGLVTSERRGYFIHYSLSGDGAERCRAVIGGLFPTENRTKKGERRCAAKKRSAKGRRN